MKATILAIAVGVAALAGSGSSAAAFWQRSQVSACADATNEAERLRLRCFELNAYADPGWPALGLGLGGAYGGSGYDVPGERRFKPGAATRRLG